MKKIKNYIKKNKKEIIFLSILILFFIILSILVVNDLTIDFDILIHSYILNIRNKTLTSFLSIITNIAGATFLLATSAILFIIIKNKKTPLYISINLISAFVINETFKAMFTRTRPIGINLIEETGFSFPSGHSMVGLAFYGFITYLLCKKQKNKITKIIIFISYILITLLIGFSRLYLGVHYLTDIIGGFILALIYLTIYIKLINIEKK